MGQLSGYKKGFQINGGITGGGELYGVSGIEDRRAPWSYFINGRINMSASGFSVPVSFSYQDRQLAYDYSFNRLSIQPRYKWAKLLLGRSSMNFSPYTLSGRAFNGYGVELSPGKLYVAAIKGTIENPFAIRDSLAVGNSLIPIYDRDILGAKVGYRSGKNKIELIGLKVEDDKSSFTLPDDYKELGYQIFTPKENINIGLNIGFKIGRHLDLYLNSAASGFTGDVDDPLTESLTGDIPKQISDIYTINTSTRFAFAGDAGVNFYINSTRLGVKYKRVEPFYTTMATDYFINDIQQWTFLFSNSFLDRKLRLDANIGIENNNLGGYRTSTTDRFIGNFSLNIMPSQEVYASIKYSNFQTEAVNEIINLNDTLRYVSVTHQYGVFGGMNFGDESIKYGLNANIFFQEILDQSEIQRLGDLNALNITFSPSVTMEEYQLKISPNIFYNKFSSEQTEQERYGLGLRLDKSFLDKKLNSNFSGRYSLNDYDKRNDGKVGYFSLSIKYKTTLQSSLQLIASYRTTNSIIKNSFNETRTRIRYGYNF